MAEVLKVFENLETGIDSAANHLWDGEVRADLGLDLGEIGSAHGNRTPGHLRAIIFLVPALSRLYQ